MNRWRSWGVPSVAFLAITLAICWRLWTPIKGERKDFAWDTQWEYWGDLQFQLDAYRDGELPLWNPYDRAGYPFHADPQVGLLYPPTWGLLAIGRLVGGVPPWLIDLKDLLHIWLGGLGLYAYLRRRGLPEAAGYVGGLLFILSSPFIRHAELALTWSMAWAPWVLLAVDVWAETPSLRAAAALAVALAMGFLAGAAPTFWYTLVVAAPYTVWALLHHRRRGYLVSGAVCAALLVAICAAQLVATSALVPHTVRADRNLEFFTGGAFGVADVISFVVPRLTNLNNYIGFGAVLWIAAVVSLRPDARTLVLLAVAVAGVLFSWGTYTDALALGGSVVPAFKLFRYAFRYVYVSVVPLAILAAEGLALLAALDPDERRRRVGRILLGAAAAAVVIAGVGFAANAKEREAWGMLFVTAIVAGWVTAMVIHSPKKRTFLAVAAVMLGVDMFVAHVDAVEKAFHPLIDTSRDGGLAKLAGVPLEARIYDRKYLKFRPGLRNHVRDFGGYEGDPLALLRYALLRDAVPGASPNLGHLNVRWLLDEKKGPIEIAKVAPAVFFTTATQLVDGPGAPAVRALFATAPGSTAILERGTVGELPAGPALTAAGRLTALGRNHLSAEIDAPAAGVVVITEAFHPGWSATVDGAPAPIVPANVLFRGLVVGPGHHVIEMRYSAGPFLPLALVELFALAVAAGLCWRRRA